jgi:hypothetical protein
VKVLGHGSSAVIEKISHKVTGQLFALKAFRRHSTRQFENLRRAFDNEVSIMERLSSHIHIIQVLGTFICDRELCILMSPVASDGDLAAYLARVLYAGMAGEEELVLNRAFGCLTSGLAYMHEQTIRHKDIKPQNILIHHGRVLYTDFGISFDADQQDTTTVGPPGRRTLRYCAPEVEDHANRNRKADVYSLGCVFVEILDVLEPEIGFRHMDRLPYSQKLGQVRHTLDQANVTGRARKDLLRVCHAMLNPNQVDRIDTGSVLRRIARLGSFKDEFEIGLFCDDCSAMTNCKDAAAQEELVDDSAVPAFGAHTTLNNISSGVEIEGATAKAEGIRLGSSKIEPEVGLVGDDDLAVEERNDIATQGELMTDYVALTFDARPTVDLVSLNTPVESTATKMERKRKKKKTVTSVDVGGEGKATASPRTFSSGTTRYYCTTCGEMGHRSSKCPNKCRACGELYHKSADCPNKCWTCGQVGHKAKSCPNECDACGTVGHQEDDCPDACWTCGEVGHFARDCQDPCFVCGRLGHGTQKCWGKCHKCGKIGHWKRDCADACFECRSLCSFELTVLIVAI